MRSTVDRSGVWSRWLAIILAILGPLSLGASNAVAQGMVHVSEPITGAEIEAYSERLNLSRAQRQAVEREYNAYLESFRNMQRREIMPAVRDLHRRFGQAMAGELDEFDAVHRGTKQIEGRIAAADSAFFDEVEAILSDEQKPMLQRVRLMRERHRYSRFPFTQLDTRRVNLAENVADISLADHEAEAVDAVLMQYEVELTRRYERVFESAITLMSDRFKAFHELQMPDGSDEAEQVASQFELMQEVDQRLMRERHRDYAAVMNLDRQTYQRIAAIISPDSQRQLRETFYSAAYRDTHFLSNQEWEGLFTVALEQHDLDADDRQRIASAFDATRARHDELLENMVDLIHWFSDEKGGIAADEEDVEQYRNRMNELRTRSRQNSLETMEFLRDVLGDRAEQIRVTHRERARQRRADQVPRWEDPEAWQVFQSDPSSFARGPYRLILRPIDRIDLEVYARLLGLTEDAFTILETLHESYMDRHNEAVPDLIDQWRTSYQRMMSNEPDVDENDIDGALNAISQTVRAVEQLDAGFFDDVTAMFLDDEEQDRTMAVIRLLRDRDVYQTSQTRYRRGRRNTTNIDHVRVLALMPQARQVDWPALMPMLHEYQQSIVPHVRGRYDIEVRLTRMMRSFSLEANRLHRDDASLAEQLDVDVRRARATTPIVSQRGAQNKAIADLNRQMLARLMESLPDDIAAQYEEQYTKIAFSNVYSQELPVQRLIREIRQLPDLNTRQQQELGELTAEYHAEYARVITSMLEISRRADEMAASADNPVPEVSDAMRRAASERARLQQATIRQLRLLLEREQIDRIAGWPNVDAEQAAINVIP